MLGVRFHQRHPGELSADELVTGLMQLRGDVSKGDIVAIMLKANGRQKDSETKLGRGLNIKHFGCSFDFVCFLLDVFSDAILALTAISLI